MIPISLLAIPYPSKVALPPTQSLPSTSPPVGAASLNTTTLIFSISVIVQPVGGTGAPPPEPATVAPAAPALAMGTPPVPWNGGAPLAPATSMPAAPALLLPDDGIPADPGVIDAPPVLGAPPEPVVPAKENPPLWVTPPFAA